jgi:hypothetical protein
VKSSCGCGAAVESSSNESKSDVKDRDENRAPQRATSTKDEKKASEKAEKDANSKSKKK